MPRKASPAAAAGYSGTPLARKLGIGPGARVYVASGPSDYPALLAPLPAGVRFTERCDATTDVAHLFVTRRASLATTLARWRKALRPDAVVWVSWPKQSSGVATEVGEGTIREVALPLGFVDVKVCAVDATWSALKLVVRTALR